MCSCLQKNYENQTDFFENTFIKDKKYHAQKSLKICTGCRVSAAKIYLYHSTEIAKARPHSEGIS